MLNPFTLRTYLQNDYPQIDFQLVDVFAIVNNTDLIYNDDRDIEQRDVNIASSSAFELSATSVKRRNILQVNQRKLWETLGWSTLGAIGIDWKVWTSLGAVLLLLKDFKGIQTHNFSPIESNVLYAIYRTGRYDEPYFTADQVFQTYNSIFDTPIKIDTLASVLTELEQLLVIETEGLGYVIREEINLDKRTSRFLR